MGEHKERGSICAFYIKCLSVFSFFNLDSCLKKSRKKTLKKKKELRANIFKVFQSNTAYEHKICHVLPSLLSHGFTDILTRDGKERPSGYKKTGASCWDGTLVDESSVRLLTALDGVPPGNLVSQLPFS